MGSERAQHAGLSDQGSERGPGDGDPHVRRGLRPDDCMRQRRRITSRASYGTPQGDWLAIGAGRETQTNCIAAHDRVSSAGGSGWNSRNSAGVLGSQSGSIAHGISARAEDPQRGDRCQRSVAHGWTVGLHCVSLRAGARFAGCAKRCAVCAKSRRSERV